MERLTDIEKKLRNYFEGNKTVLNLVKKASKGDESAFQKLEDILKKKFSKILDELELATDEAALILMDLYDRKVLKESFSFFKEVFSELYEDEDPTVDKITKDDILSEIDELMDLAETDFEVILLQYLYELVSLNKIDYSEWLRLYDILEDYEKILETEEEELEGEE